MKQGNGFQFSFNVFLIVSTGPSEPIISTQFWFLAFYWFTFLHRTIMFVDCSSGYNRAAGGHLLTADVKMYTYICHSESR